MHSAIRLKLHSKAVHTFTIHVKLKIIHQTLARIGKKTRKQQKSHRWLGGCRQQQEKKKYVQKLEFFPSNLELWTNANFSCYPLSFPGFLFPSNYLVKKGKKALSNCIRSAECKQKVSKALSYWVADSNGKNQLLKQQTNKINNKIHCTQNICK